MMHAALRARLFPYMGGILRELDAIPHLINGPNDHVHILGCLPARRALSEITRVLKTNSSRWVHEQFPANQMFAWQTGYAAFSVSKSITESVHAYIATQEEHHRRVSFHDEYLNFLKKHDIEYDPRFVFDGEYVG